MGKHGLDVIVVGTTDVCFFDECAFAFRGFLAEVMTHAYLFAHDLTCPCV